MKALLEQDQRLPVLGELLRRWVCSICVNRNVNGTCDVDSRHECALFERLPQITQSISRIRSDKIDADISAIQESVCAECYHQHLDGSCKQREEHRCALARHRVPIIWAVESFLAATHVPSIETISPQFLDQQLLGHVSK
jgi:hypothetical protein